MSILRRWAWNSLAVLMLAPAGLTDIAKAQNQSVPPVKATLTSPRHQSLSSSSSSAKAPPASPQTLERSDHPQVPGNDVSPCDRYLARLDLPRWADREQASAEMRADFAITSDSILSCLKARWSELSPEQRDRLIEIGGEKFNMRPGAIGIQFTNSVDQRIQNVIAGTPASKVLQPGDQLVKINDTILSPEDPIARQQQLMDALGRFQAGDKIRVTVNRTVNNVEKQIEVEVELADPLKLPGYQDFRLSIENARLRFWRSRIAAIHPTGALEIQVDMAPADLRLGQDPGSGGANAADIMNLLQARMGEVSRQLAAISAIDVSALSAEKRSKTQEEYLALRDQLSRVAARLQLLTAPQGNHRIK